MCGIANKSWVLSGYHPPLVNMSFNPGDGKMCVESVRPGHKAIKKPQYFGGILSNKHLDETKAIRPKIKICSAEKTLYQKVHRINIICYIERVRNKTNHRDNIIFYHIKTQLSGSCIISSTYHYYCSSSGAENLPLFP